MFVPNICQWTLEVILGLTHLPKVPRICISELGNIGSGNGLSPIRRQAITWTSFHLLSMQILGKNFSEIRLKNKTFLSLKCTWKCRLQNGDHFVQGNAVHGHWTYKYPDISWHPICILNNVASAAKTTESFNSFAPGRFEWNLRKV